jgi:hypothetical protein
MKLAWRQILVGRVRFTLPGITIEVQPLNPEVAEKLHAHKAEMATCAKCHKLYVNRYPLSLISHLVDGHSVDSFVAIQIVEDLGRRTLAKHAERRAEALVTAN